MKLIVCDVEGTIFDAQYRIDGTEYASTLWQPIAQALGEDAVREEYLTHKKWDNLQYNTYLDWVEDSIRIHRNYGLEEKVFNSLINDAKYKPGVVKFFKELDRSEYIPVLVSGGFQNLIERAQRELNIKYGFGACNYIFGKSGKLFGYSLQPSDFKDKMNTILWIFDHYGLDNKRDWIFIGDGKNDKYIAELAPISFGIDPHPELEKVVDFKIESFDEILPLLETKHTDNIKIRKGKGIIDEPTTRIEKLEKDIDDLRKCNMKLRYQLDELITTKQNNKFNSTPVHEEDYSKKPIKTLGELLEDCNIVIIGLTQREDAYYKFSNYHKNLRVIEGFDKSYDTKILRKANFIFKVISVMSDTVGFKAEKELSKKPHSEIRLFRNAKIIETAMANVLCRYFNLEANDTFA